MTLKETLAELQEFGNEKMFAQNKKNGVGDNQYGVRLGDIRKVVKKIKIDHDLALELWQNEMLEARLLATLVVNPKKLSVEEMDAMVGSISTVQVADWYNAYIVKKHPDNEVLRQKWMEDSRPMAVRAGWNLTSQRLAKKYKNLDVKSILDRIESEMDKADNLVQWTMNFSLAEIGINYPEHRDRALAVGERLGIYRDYPVSKGCTSPFAPLWINEMVSRQS